MVNEPFFARERGGGVMKPTKLLRFLKKRIIRVKTVIMVSFRNKKIFFVVFYIKI